SFRSRRTPESSPATAAQPLASGAAPCSAWSLLRPKRDFRTVTETTRRTLKCSQWRCLDRDRGVYAVRCQVAHAAVDARNEFLIGDGEGGARHGLAVGIYYVEFTLRHMWRRSYAIPRHLPHLYDGITDADE